MGGYWINMKNGKYEEVWEHASWIYEKANQRLIGLPESIGQQIRSLPPSDFKGDSRKDIVMLATQEGLIRVRCCYGGAISFEFQSMRENRKKALDSIYKFLLSTDMPGHYTQITINNLTTNESIGILWKDFSKKMGKDDTDEILRIAKEVRKR